MAHTFDVKRPASSASVAVSASMGKVQESNLDDEHLNAPGYGPHMKRGFTLWSMIAFCLTGIGLLPSLGGTLSYSLGCLALLPMTWGWLIASIFILSTAFSLAELSSSMLTAGGLYHWTYHTTPPKLKRISCWITAWSMVLSASFSGGSFFMTQAQMIHALIVMFHPHFAPTDWQIYLIYLGCIIACALVMILPSRRLGEISNIFVWMSTMTFFVMLIALPNYAKKNDNHNSANKCSLPHIIKLGWTRSGLVFLLTFLTPYQCISGYESTAHLAEETENAATVVLAYAAKHIDAIFASPLSQPVDTILQIAIGNGGFTKVLWI
ncbi:hypothetical protein P154DRAFT_540300 [Amniculicola lignicola CBS 123094]|uniref:Amino acid transporter n=1 Tax=Amniculicola lignicola CBS 123094 TaxID=1392246 RepID=A0A6A5W0B2_9PLEO|nr:hypothetical protein P154DRAFT_540300 [Amniculicola lignicola CBS 123094]